MYNNPPKTLFIGQNLIFLPICHSTNDKAAEMLRTIPPPEGTVVVAHQQTHGRGQRGNSWQAEPGKNLTFSCILRPSFLDATQQFRLNIAVSLAVFDFLHAYLPTHLRIKWPNDLYWNDQKLGGILIENSIQGSQLMHSVVGIGLNINQLQFPDTLRATSLSLATMKEDGYNLEILLNELLEFLEKYYLQLRNGNFVSQQTYYQHHLYGWGVKRRFQHQNQILEGIIIGITETGMLEIESENNRYIFAFKEIEFLF